MPRTLGMESPIIQLFANNVMLEKDHYLLFTTLVKSRTKKYKVTSTPKTILQTCRQEQELLTTENTERDISLLITRPLSNTQKITRTQLI